MPNLKKIGQALWSADARPATAFAVLAGVAVLVHRLLPTGSLPQNLVYDAVGVAAVAAIVAGVVIYRPERPQPWLLLAAGQLLFVTGDALWTILELMGESPFPSIADVAYLLGYPLLVVAFLMAIRLRVRGGDRAGLLDGAILASACALVGWVVLVRPVLDSADDPISLIVTAAYPLGDLVILGVAIGLLSTPGARTTSFVLLIASIVTLFVADTAYALQVASGTYVDGGELDSLWLFSYIAMGSAALHRSMRDVVAPHPVAVAWLGKTRLSLLALAMLTGPALVLIVNVQWESDVPMLAIGSALLSLLVLWRLASVVRALARDNAARVKLEGELSYRASHDPLTGLPNRRRFVERLDGALGLREPARRSPCCSSTSTTSRPSTTASGTPRATRCWSRSPAGSSSLPARRRHASPGSVATSSRSCSTAATSRGRERVAERLLAALDEPVEIEGREVVRRASIGIVDRLGHDGATADELLRDADIAMYRAKRAGKGRVRRLRARDARAVAATGSSSRRDLRRALERGRAPRRLPADRRRSPPARVLGVEALVRWQHPERGLLAPDDVHPARRGDRAHRRRSAAGCSTRRCRQRRRRGGSRASRRARLSVNLSPAQLAQPRPRRRRRRRARRRRPRRPTRSCSRSPRARMLDADVAPRAAPPSSRRSASELAIDDFGTGYSSLSYLQPPARRHPQDRPRLRRRSSTTTSSGASRRWCCGSARRSAS